jgi:competence protein ComEC
MLSVTWSDVVFYTAAGAFALGIFVRSFYDLPLSVAVWLLVLAFSVAIVRRWYQSAASNGLLLVVVLLVGISLGVTRLEWASATETIPAFASLVEQEVTLAGVVVREPDVRARFVHLYLQTDDGLLHVSTDRLNPAAYGDQIVVTGTLQRPEAFETDLGRTFNYPGFLLVRGVAYQVPFAEVAVLSSGHGNPVIAGLLSFKHAFMEQLRLVMGEPQTGLGEGLLLGAKKALGEDWERIFRETGIIHIVVLSGYNVMLVVAAVMFVLGSLFGVRVSAVVGVVAISGFALMVGLSATVLRASVMAGLLLLAQATGRIYLVTKALVLAGVIMLIVNPYLLAFDPGFQLSFMATLGLIVAGPLISGYLALVPNWLGAREFLAATLATQLFVLPLLLYQIGEVSVVSVMVNVLVLPMVPVAMLLTFVTGMVAFVSTTIASFLALITYASLSYILAVAAAFATVPFAAVTVPALPFMVVPLGYAGLFILVWYLTRGHKRPRVAPAGEALRDWTIVEEATLRAELQHKQKAPTEAKLPSALKY